MLTDLWRDEFNQVAETRVRSVDVPVDDWLVVRDPMAQAVEVCDSAVDGGSGCSLWERAVEVGSPEAGIVRG